ncbi:MULTISPECIES: DNA sulfur modification protein DndB [unclassified Bacillus (in: firmicutes)]|uniref:DNA sulfur modification protein DndB n=1 Tax=unclassified Bacillus (in: firmicutes) TaxID=185979 RepID=UPI0008EA185F|nr:MULTISPECIES: DNA sulfur modification protein DndB [unclassified Bacillus (in: firmicutes)]SFA86042.1 DNA-sulfur modification-associated [Bacillus sp. UNCCL13]SFQ83571.1 DNA-sulfur modification-associated [Bacillus sp. cl95]
MAIHLQHQKRKTLFCVTIQELTDCVREGRVITKQVTPSRVKAITHSLFMNAEKQQLFFSPMVANLESGNLEHWVDGKISIIDGSHRLKAFQHLAEIMEKSILSERKGRAKIGWNIYYLMQNCRIPIQIYEGLSEKEQSQLYIDLHKKKMTRSNKILLSKDTYINWISNYLFKVDAEGGNEGTKKAMSLSQLKKIVNIFVTGKLIQGDKNASFKPCLRREEYVQLIHYWKNTLNEMCARNTTLSSLCDHFTNIVAIAQFVNHKYENASCAEREQILQERMGGLEKMETRFQVWELFEAMEAEVSRMDKQLNLLNLIGCDDERGNKESL